MEAIRAEFISVSEGRGEASSPSLRGRQVAERHTLFVILTHRPEGRERAPVAAGGV
jgi:hypothetical protein